MECLLNEMNVEWVGEVLEGKKGNRIKAIKEDMVGIMLEFGYVFFVEI